MPMMNICPTASRTLNSPSTSFVISSTLSRVSSGASPGGWDGSSPHPAHAIMQITNMQRETKTEEDERRVGVLDFKLLPPDRWRDQFTAESRPGLGYPFFGMMELSYESGTLLAS